MRKILLIFLTFSLALTPFLEATTPSQNEKTSAKTESFWDFNSKANDDLDVSMIAWGVALFVSIALAAGLINGPAPTNTPDLQ